MDPLLAKLLVDTYRESPPPPPRRRATRRTGATPAVGLRRRTARSLRRWADRLEPGRPVAATC